MPKLPTLKAPTFVTPKSMAPTDVLSAVTQTQANAFNDLVKSPMMDLGLTPLQQLPTPEMMLLQMVQPKAKQPQPAAKTTTTTATGRVLQVV